jgi:hypothetical protein
MLPQRIDLDRQRAFCHTPPPFDFDLQAMLFFTRRLPVRNMGLLLATICLLSVVSTAPAHAEGWRDWVPFSGKDEPATKKKKTSTSSSRSPMWAQKSKKSTSKSSADEPGMLSRMGTGTKQFFGRTKDALTWGDDDAAPAKRPSGVSWNGSARKPREEEKSAWWNFWQRDESRPSKTVEDFMNQERPEHVN